jgi:hypothetical protein
MPPPVVAAFRLLSEQLALVACDIVSIETHNKVVVCAQIKEISKTDK